MPRRCACGGTVQQRNMQDISYDPIQQCADCGTVFVNRRVLEEVERSHRQRRNLV